MNKIFLKLIVGVLSCVLTGYAAPSNAKIAIEEAAKAGQFLCLTFYEVKDASCTSMSSTIEAFKKKSTKKIALYNAKMSDAANKEISDKYGVPVGNLPLLLIIAPNGVVTGGFPKAVTAEQLKQSTAVSDLMLQVLKPLQEQKVALVALQNSTTKFNTESWQGVSDFAADAQYKSLVTAVKADPSTPDGMEFLKQCQLISPLTEATVVVLLPPGRIGKVLSGKVAKADILKSLQACAAGSSCAPGACSDRRFKQEIAPIDSALDKVVRLQGVTFTWNKSAFPRRFFPDGSEVGLIAQDVESIVPQVVQTDEEGFKSITYDKLTALLIEALKDLKQKVDAQDSIIKVQSAQIKALEAKK